MLWQQSSRDSNICVDIFDEFGLGGGASGVAGGLIHPYSPKAKVLWKGEECWKECLELLRVAVEAAALDELNAKSKKTDGYIVRRSILRPAISVKNFDILSETVSCSDDFDDAIFDAVKYGETEYFLSLMEAHPTRWGITTPFIANSLLHIAAGNGHTRIMSILLDRSSDPNLLNSRKQTPLMLASMRGNLSSVHLLLCRGANLLMFDSVYGRTPLHHAAYYGNMSCLQAILSAAADSNDISVSWGFSRFVNARDQNGETPLHLASRKRHPLSVHLLLENGALVSAATGGYGFPGSTPLHLAAQGGCIDCIRELLAWGADRLQRDESGRIPYVVALTYRHGPCTALLNPSTAEPLVWPSPFKFINELKQDAKNLLEQALMEANKERERIPREGTNSNIPPHQHSGITTDVDDPELDDNEMCCICFEKACTIEVEDCGHQMCAQCMLILCCHNKPNPTTARPATPNLVCPFCRSSISRLAVATSKPNKNSEQLVVIEQSST